MLYEKNIWIDFEEQSVYDSLEQVPEDKIKNFVEAKPEFQEQCIYEDIVYCSSMNDFQHYATDYSDCMITADWKRHRWTNDYIMLLSSLPIDELFNLLKEKNKTSLDFIHSVWRGLFDEECMDETVNVLLGDDISNSYARDIEE